MSQKISLSRQWSFPDGSMVKNLPTKQEASVYSLGQEDPLEKELVTHCSAPAWGIS